MCRTICDGCGKTIVFGCWCNKQLDIKIYCDQHTNPALLDDEFMEAESA